MKKFFFREREFELFNSVYEPSEDSYLLAENVQVKNGWKCLDIGCGSGIQTINLLFQGAKVFAVDVNENALENTLQNATAIVLENGKKINLEKNLQARKSNLFENMKEDELFDCIVFNPPYVPSNEKKFIELDGGKKGRQVLDEFLQQFPAHLKEKGICYFLQSSLNGEKETEKILQEKEFNFEVVARKKLFFEELLVFMVWKND